ncbi:MAG: GNAT family N-acetyltransferase [Oscillospiraceae bacterium]|nr:GNAT family N-acetyltransferase [Oscillospiraceae bacterium]
MRYAQFSSLETQRLILRQLRQEDVYEYYERLFGDGDVCRYMLFSPHQDIGESLESLQRKLSRYETGPYYCWGITEKDEDSLIGLVELVRLDEQDDSCSFVYMLGCNYWNRGYGTEALKAVFRFAFEELEVERIVADHMADNAASGCAMRKAGMTHIGTEPGKYEKLYQVHDAHVYEIRNNRGRGLTANRYQKLAMTTLNPALDKKDVLINGVMGLCGESGEAIDIVKKWLAQGHELDREKLAKELGDIAWYLAETAWALEIPLEDILQGNLDKLKQRYPEGFDAERSINR